MSEEDKQRLKEYQKNYCQAKKSAYFFLNLFCFAFFLHCIKMRNELIFSNGYNDYSIDKYYF